MSLSNLARRESLPLSSCDQFRGCADRYQLFSVNKELRLEMDVGESESAVESTNENEEQSVCDVEPLSSSSDSGDDNDNWYYMPDSILLTIFKLLTPKSLVTAGTVCKQWNRVSKDEFLWKDLFYRTYKIEPSVGIMPGKKTKPFVRSKLRET